MSEHQRKVVAREASKRKQAEAERELGRRVLEILQERAWAAANPREFAHSDAAAMGVILFRARSLGLLPEGGGQ